VFATVAASGAERAAPRAGDRIVQPADVVMDRAFTLDGEPEDVWPWLVQLGKRRAGWYLPRTVERFLPRSRRGVRTIETQWQSLALGDVIPDYGGRDATFEVAEIEPLSALVYCSQRGRTGVSWAITLEPHGPGRTRVFLRLRLGPVRHQRLAGTVGDLFDLVTIAGLAGGLRERLATTR
jgi:hypothetical protein